MLALLFHRIAFKKIRRAVGCTILEKGKAVRGGCEEMTKTDGIHTSERFSGPVILFHNIVTLRGSLKSKRKNVTN